MASEKIVTELFSVLSVVAPDADDGAACPQKVHAAA
jgi:hypothetical protein